MPELKSSPEVAPGYAHHRQVIAAPDPVPNDTNSKHGINMSHYRDAHIQVVPSGGANPTVSVLWWSAAANAFVQEHTPISKAGAGVDAPYEFTVEAKGRIMWVKVTAGVAAAQQCDIYVSGYDMDHSL